MTCGAILRRHATPVMFTAFCQRRPHSPKVSHRHHAKRWFGGKETTVELTDDPFDVHSVGRG